MWHIPATCDVISVAVTSNGLVPRKWNGLMRSGERNYRRTRWLDQKDATARVKLGVVVRAED